MKKLNLIILPCFLLTFGSSLKAQFESVDLNSYKTTDFRFKILGTGFRLGNSSTFFNSKNVDDYKSRSNTLFANGNVAFSSETYSRNYIGSHIISLSVFSDNNTWKRKYESQDDPLKNSYLRFDLNTNLQSSNTFYFSKNTFFEIITLIDYRRYSIKNKNNLPTIPIDAREEVDKNNTINSNFELNLGKGRVENATDLRLAIYILDDLNKQRKLFRIPNESELYEFADFLTIVLNKRVIDSRIKRIKEFVEIDSFLVTKKLVQNTDGLYFGYLNDNLEFARLHSWLSGYKVFVGVNPFFNEDRIDDENIGVVNKSKLSNYGIGFNAKYSSQWISGLKWQKGYSITASYSINKFDTLNIDGFYDDYKSLNAQARYSISYIPNTRTTISGYGDLNFDKRFYDTNQNWLMFIASISGACNYYFSEKLRFNVYAGIYYRVDKYYDPASTGNRFSLGLSASFTYYIF